MLCRWHRWKEGSSQRCTWTPEAGNSKDTKFLLQFWKECSPTDTLVLNF